MNSKEIVNLELRVANCLLLFLLSLICACSAGNLKPEVARKVIASELSIPETQITIVSASGVSSSSIVEATIRLSFAMQMGSDGKWFVVKISRTPGQWENPGSFRMQSPLSRSLEAALQSELKKKQ